MSTPQPRCLQAAAREGRKGALQLRVPLASVSWLLISFAMVASGCNRYEYEVQVANLESGKITSAKLGTALLRHGQNNNDPLAIMSAVNILARSRSSDGAPPVDRLEDLLKKAATMEMEMVMKAGRLDEIAKEVRKSFGNSNSPHWLGRPLPLDDANLAKLLFEYGEDQKDPLGLIGSFRVLNKLPADISKETKEDYANKLKNINSQYPEQPMWQELSDEVLRQAVRGIVTPNPLDWPTFLGPNGDGIAGSIGDGSWQPETLNVSLNWHTSVGIGYGMCSIRRFDIDDDNFYDQLFQFDRHGDKLRLSCLDAETGEPFKGFQPFEYSTDYVDLRGYNGGPRCSPVVDGNQVYIYGPEGKLHCINAFTGELIWGPLDMARTYNVVQNQFGVGSTPLVVGNELIVVVGGSDPKYQDFPPERLQQVKGNGSAIVALDIMTGEEKYRIGNHLASYASPQKATINGEVWCFVFVRDGLIGFRPDELKLEKANSTDRQSLFHFHQWQSAKRDAVSASTPVVTDSGQVFISMAYDKGSSLLQLHPEKGFEVLWSDDPINGEPAMAMQFATPILHEGYLYGSSGEGTAAAELRCIEWQSGAFGWKEAGLGRTSMLYVDNHFICLTEYGKLLLVKADPKKFEQIDAFEKAIEAALRKVENDNVSPGFSPPRVLKYPCWTAPALWRGRLYVRGPDQLVCFQLDPQLPE